MSDWRFFLDWVLNGLVCQLCSERTGFRFRRGLCDVCETVEWLNKLERLVHGLQSKDPG